MSPYKNLQDARENKRQWYEKKSRIKRLHTGRLEK
jgi:hypothetical protein